MSKTSYITCPECGEVFQSLGYARHRAMHRDKRKTQAKKTQQPLVSNLVCDDMFIEEMSRDPIYRHNGYTLKA